MTLEQFQLFFSFYKCWVWTHKPSAMHSNSRVSPLRTILVLVDPIGYMNPGWWSPSGLSEGTRTVKSQRESFSYRHQGWKHIITLWRKGGTRHEVIWKLRKKTREFQQMRGVSESERERNAPGRCGRWSVSIATQMFLGQKQPPPVSCIQQKTLEISFHYWKKKRCCNVCLDN